MERPEGALAMLLAVAKNGEGNGGLSPAGLVPIQTCCSWPRVHLPPLSLGEGTRAEQPVNDSIWKFPDHMSTDNLASRTEQGINDIPCGLFSFPATPQRQQTAAKQANILTMRVCPNVPAWAGPWQRLGPCGLPDLKQQCHGQK